MDQSPRIAAGLCARVRDPRVSSVTGRRVGNAVIVLLLAGLVTAKESPGQGALASEAVGDGPAGRS